MHFRQLVKLLILSLNMLRLEY